MNDSERNEADVLTWVRALQEVASWEDEAPARGEREFARMVLAANGWAWPGPAVVAN